jgi:hypothetical protein
MATLIAPPAPPPVPRKGPVAATLVKAVAPFALAGVILLIPRP